MKMSREMFEELKGMLTETMERITVEELSRYRSFLKDNGTYKDLERRFTWDVFHRCDRNRKLNFMGRAYEDGLHDDHVYTALRRIVREYIAKGGC